MIKQKNMLVGSLRLS